MLKKQREPHLRVVVTPYCNLKCPYCKLGGEGYSGEPNIFLTPKEIQKIVEICTDIWLKNVKVSGGEPLLREDLVEILDRLVSTEKLETIQLVTNGVLLSKCYTKIVDIDFTGITVSLDTVNKESYKIITGKDELDNVLKGIKIVKKHGKHPITINCVITRNNISEVKDMVKFASEIDVTLKLIDFMNLDYSPELKWEDYFVDFLLLSTYLETNLGLKYLGVEKPVGGLGTPQLLFDTKNGTKVMLRDAQVGTNYHENCKQCRFYPCHDALISMRITHNGYIKRCLIRDDNLVDIRTPLREGNTQKVRELIYGSYSILKDAKYYPHKWSPAVEHLHMKNIRWSDDCDKILTP